MNLTGLNRRILALILCALLTLGMVPATALASEMEVFTDTVSSAEPTPEEEAVVPTQAVFETVAERTQETLSETIPETTSETIPETTSVEPEEGWDYDTLSQTLTIWEDLPDAVYDPSTDLYFAPWDARILEVRHVVVAPGVTRLGAGFFAEAVALEDITLPDSLASIGAHAFRSCVSLTPPVLSSEVTLGEGVFAYAALEDESEPSQLAEGPVLDSLRISLGEDTPVALNRPFQGEVTSYTAPTPLAVDASLMVEATGSGTITIGEISGESATVTPLWQADGTWSLTVSIAQEDGAKTDYAIVFISAEAGITGIEIETPPTKTLYQEGEPFDPTGMTVTVHLGEEETRTAAAEALYCTPQGALSRDVTAIDVTYAGKTASQPITVLGSLTGSGTQEEPYLLWGEEDIRTLDAWVTAEDARAAGYFRMEDSIALTGTWEGIGDKNHPFTGDFDGGDNQISIPEGGKALFAKTRGAVIHDLKVYGPKIADYGLVSIYSVDKTAPYYAQFLRVTLVSGTQTLKSGFIGGYASGEDSVLIDDCHVEAGVIIGYDKTQKHIGSFGGEFNGEISNSTSAATVYGTDWVGGIVANKGQSIGDLNVRNCSFTGALVATGKYVGGIVGAGYGGTGWGMVSAPNAWGVVIKDCTCSGSVTGGNAVGGILGAEACVQQFWGNGQGSILNNRFTGTLTAGDGAFAGGIIGFLQSLNRYMTISGNYYKNGDTGIGAVAHVDTSGVTGGFHDGTFYYDTSKDALETINCVALETYIDLPTIGEVSSGKNRAVTTRDCNRTDDPLGADREKLCYSDPEIQKYVSELIISGSFETQYTLGQELNLTGIVLTARWSDGSTTPLTLADVSLSGYNKNKEGSQTVTLEYQSAKAQFTVNVKPKTNKITVSVAIYGDSKHGEDTVHGMARGGLTLWGRDTQMEAQTTDTVWDVVQRLAQENGLTIQASFSSKYNSYYIEGVNGLAEYDNGPGSGWMYTLNGAHPEVGVSARYVKDGDTIVLHYTDDFNYEEGGIYYGQPLRDAAYVDSLIQAIGEPAFTQASKQKIDEARKAYDALSDAQKGKVTRLSVLEAAEAKYQELSQAEDANKAKNVINLINKIGTVTASSGDAIEMAQSAYDALTDAQKKLVSNYSVLEKATADWNKAMARQVMDLIENIPTPITTAGKQKIDEARKAYDALSAQQKKLVTNYKTLTQAETAYAKLTASTQDKQDAKAVEDLIAGLGTITENSRDEVEKARTAYEKLSHLQKQLVENYDILEAAEKKLALLASLGKVAGAYVDTGDYMEALGTPAVGTIGGEWMVIGLTRSGRTISGEDSYYAGVERYVRESIDENGRLHKAKSTDNSRLILALTALGRDVTDVAGHDLLRGLSQMDFVKKQGNNGPIWALLALDSGNYPVPQGGDVTRQALVEEILSVQTSDGGWAISGDAADSDMTGMALQALAPYCSENAQVRQAVDRAIHRLSQMQMDNGGFGTFSGNGKVETAESVSQVIVALTALGIDPDTDERFVKNGTSALDALLRYALPGGGFRHVPSGGLDGMATEQGYYALTAYSRFLEGKTSLYNMTDVIDRGGDVEIPIFTPMETQPQAEPEQAPQEKTSSPVLWVVLALALGLGVGIGGTLAVVCIVPSLKKKGSSE